MYLVFAGNVGDPLDVGMSAGPFDHVRALEVARERADHEKRPYRVVHCDEIAVYGVRHQTIIEPRGRR